MDTLVLNAKKRINFDRIYLKTIKDTIEDLRINYGMSELIALSSGIISDTNVIPKDDQKITYVEEELYNTLIDKFQLNDGLIVDLKLSENIYDLKLKHCIMDNSCITFIEILNNNKILPNETRLIEIEEKFLMIINTIDQFFRSCRFISDKNEKIKNNNEFRFMMQRYSDNRVMLDMYSLLGELTYNEAHLI